MLNYYVKSTSGLFVSCARWRFGRKNRAQVFYRHNEAAKLLIAARAHLHGGLQPAISIAAVANNVEAVRLLSLAGANARAKDILGHLPLRVAAAYGAKEALDELLRQVPHSALELSMALFSAVTLRGGSVGLVHHLVALRADVNLQARESWLSRAIHPWRVAGLGSALAGTTPPLAPKNSGSGS